MFVEYLEKLRMSGKRHFSMQEIIQDLKISNTAARSGLYRLKRDNKVISPVKGLYVIVPPEHQPHGCIPAEELVPIMMNYLKVEYYVALYKCSSILWCGTSKNIQISNYYQLPNCSPFRIWSN